MIRDMNHHPLELSHSNHSSRSEQQSRSPGESSRLVEGLAGMNRDLSQNDSDDGASNKSDKQTMVPLHKDFVPGDDDVICGRGKKCYAHTGNERFRQIVQSHLEQYSAATSRPEKSEILSSIVAEVRKNSPDGGFVKQDPNGDWYEVGDFLAREKTSQAFRDALFSDYRSSKKSKHEKRRQKTQATKALSEKQAAKMPRTADQRAADALSEQQQMLYPTPLVNRQHLTVLREETTHPRAYSFSGQTYEPRVREVPSRAMSLSSGQGGGGRVTDTAEFGFTTAADRAALAYRDPSYHRCDSAPARYFSQNFSVDDLAETELRLEEQQQQQQQQQEAHAGHSSWPQPRRARMIRPLFHPTTGTTMQNMTPPQFHPVRAEDVAAHRTFAVADTDTIMAEVEGVRSRGGPPRIRRSPGSEEDSEISTTQPQQLGQRGELLMSPSRSFGGPVVAQTPLSTAYPETPNLTSTGSSVGLGRYASLESSPQASHTAAAAAAAAAIHQRTDSTGSATVIVAQLASALQPESLAPDDNPFEPIPLPGRSKKKPKREGDDSRRKW